MDCDKDVSEAMATLAEAESTPATRVRGFKDALREIQATGRPLVVDLAEAAMDQLGGPKGFMTMMVEDLKRIRGTTEGDGKHPSAFGEGEVNPFHDPDWKVLKGLYEIIVKVITSRDKLVNTNLDPLDGVSEEDLMAIAAQAAFGALETDESFRKELLQRIAAIDPNALIDEAFKAISNMGKVEVIGG